ncbi:MAG: hypothetical protein HXY41_09615 [Chloroflexi bacterium]|nr:hypothetical protein [Chloroflexota bacterium]
MAGNQQAYADFLREYSEALGVRTLFAPDHVNYMRRPANNGKAVFSLADIYHQANLVTYPPCVEGFGSAFSRNQLLPPSPGHEQLRNLQGRHPAERFSRGRF